MGIKVKPMEKKVFVTLVGGMIAVADNEGTAVAQIADILNNVSMHLVDDAKQHGEKSRQIRVRIAHVELNLR
jgi:hypothetical protein